MRAIVHMLCLWGCLAGLAAATYNPLSAEKAAELKVLSEATPAERTLSQILKRQQGIFEAAATTSPADLSRNLSELASDYATLLRENPENVFILLHYGKFLRTVGEDERALTSFERALSIDPTLAVAYQQSALIHAENGRYQKAWPLFQTCLKQAPNIAIYQYQFGEFVQVYRDMLVEDGFLQASDVDGVMQGAFARAVMLDPASQTLAWRYAQSFYDVTRPDWKAALAAWDKAAALTADPIQEPILRMHRARCLIELGDFKAARALLDKPTPPALEKTRDDLRKRLTPA